MYDEEERKKNMFILQQSGISITADNFHVKLITGQKKHCTRIKVVFLLSYGLLFHYVLPQ